MNGSIRRASLVVATIGSLFALVIRNGRWFLVPMLVVFVLAAVLLALVSVLEYVAPFVYTVF